MSPVTQHRGVLLIVGLAAGCGAAWASGCARGPAPPPTLTLSPCTVHEIAGECGALPVFENRRSERGRRIAIRVMVLRADDAAAREAVFMFSGGPGTGSTDLAPLAGGWARPLRAALDIVLVDQRGTGGSQALTCESSAESDPASIFGSLFERSRLGACRDRLERTADLTQYTTAAAAEDVEDVRAALGYDRISLFGSSYGTRLAQAYARRFPARVRSMVLDGVAPIDMALPVTYAVNAQRALDLVFANCAEDRHCRARHPDLAAQFAAILARFEAGPIRATIRTRTGDAAVVSMRRGDFGYAVRGILYRASAPATLPDLIARAATSGDLSEFAQAYWTRHVVFDERLARGAHLSVLCSEDVPFVSDDAVESATLGTFLGRYVADEYRAACAIWRRAIVPDTDRAPVTARIPALLVSGRFDPVTPPAFADHVAGSLPLARTVVAPTGSHGSAHGCPGDAVVQALLRGSVEGLPLVCR